MDDVRIELAARGDVPALLDRIELLQRSEGFGWHPASVERALCELLDAPQLGCVGWIVDREGRRAGYFVLTFGYDLEFAGRDAFLTDLYVDPEARGRGVARAALTAIEGLAADHDVAALHLMVRPENAPAVRLYAAAGYASPPRTFLTKELPAR